jgi:hypothetical protein
VCTPITPARSLVQLRLYIEKIRPIDKQLAYQVDKLLKVTAQVAASAEADTGGGANRHQQQQPQQQQQSSSAPAAANGAGADDALQYRPNPAALLSKVPLVGDRAGV